MLDVAICHLTPYMVSAHRRRSGRSIVTVMVLGPGHCKRTDLGCGDLSERRSARVVLAQHWRFLYGFFLVGFSLLCEGFPKPSQPI
jgi:hypothetical protein